jgi:hypothetical protein
MPLKYQDLGFFLNANASTNIINNEKKKKKYYQIHQNLLEKHKTPIKH